MPMTTSTGTPTTSTSGVGKPYEKAKTIIDLVDNLMSEMVNDKLSSPAGVDVEGPYERAQNLQDPANDCHEDQSVSGQEG